jgi:hypothetical protein
MLMTISRIFERSILVDMTHPSHIFHRLDSSITKHSCFEASAAFFRNHGKANFDKRAFQEIVVRGFKQELPAVSWNDNGSLNVIILSTGSHCSPQQ